MRVLVIGGTGLISTGVTPELIKNGHEVVHYNRGKRGDSFGGVPVPKGVKTLIGDRTKPAEFKAQIEAEGGKRGFDAVIDMICYNPAEAQSLIDTFGGRVQQMIVCSTVDTYNRPAATYPITEAEPQTNPLSGYAKNKVAIEKLLLAAHAAGKFAVTLPRPGHTYGEGGQIVHSLGWTSNYLDRLKKGKPIIVHGDGQSLWASAHRDDVGPAIARIVGKKAAYGKGYNLTGGEWQPWVTYHQRIAKIAGAPEPKMVFIPTELLFKIAPQRTEIDAYNFQHSNILDTSAAERDLGFKFTIGFDEGMARTYHWLNNNGKIEPWEKDPLEDQIIAAWEKGTAEVIRAMTAV